MTIYQSMSGDAADSDAASSVGAVIIENTTVGFSGTDAALYFTTAPVSSPSPNVTLDTASMLFAAAQ